MLDSHIPCCSLHKNSTMWCLYFHLQFPPGLWMNNRQAPETNPHPPRQPTPGCRPVQMCSQCTLYSTVDRESSGCSLVCPEIWREVKLESNILRSALTTMYKSCLPISLTETWTFCLLDDRFCAFIFTKTTKFVRTPLNSCVAGALLCYCTDRVPCRWSLVNYCRGYKESAGQRGEGQRPAKSGDTYCTVFEKKT